MWWSRRAVLGHALPAAAALLAGCGFEPMYGGRYGRVTAAELAAISIDPIPETIGHFLRNDLIDRLSPTGEPERPLYRLLVQIAQSKESLAIQSDATITRFNLRLDVRFTLFDSDTGALLYQGRTRSVGSYNAVRSDFATLVAEQDTARRAAREASEEVRTLLAVYFTRRQSAT